MALDKSKDLDSIGYYLSEHLRVGGGYWTINAVTCLRKHSEIPALKLEELRSWLKSCQNSDGGFGGNTHHDSHIVNTHYALLLSYLLQCPVDLDGVANYVAQRQKPDGSFEGDIVSSSSSLVGRNRCSLLLLRSLLSDAPWETQPH